MHELLFFGPGSKRERGLGNCEVLGHASGFRISHPAFAATGANVPALVDRLAFRPCIQAHGAGGSGPFSWVDGFHLGLLSTTFLEWLHQWLKDNLFERLFGTDWWVGCWLAGWQKQT